MSGPQRGGQRRQSWRDQNSGDDRGKYIEVRQRVMDFYAKYPDGRLDSVIINAPEGGFGSRIEAITEIDRPTFSYENGVRQPKGEKKVSRVFGIVVVQGRAYRSPDDQLPGVGHSMLMLPGETPYTEGSELENAETSAIGRAIAAVGIGITDSYASAQELRNKQGDDGGTDEEEAAFAAWQAHQTATGPRSAPGTTQEPTDSAPIPDGAPRVTETPPGATRANGLDFVVRDGGGDVVGLTMPGFLDRVSRGIQREGEPLIAVSSLIVSRTAKALFGDVGSVGKLTDEQRLTLWQQVEEVLTATTD